jgi:hypothetical protein
MAASPTSYDKHLRRIVSAHEAAWSLLDDSDPHDGPWLTQVWGPWLTRWDAITADGAPLGNALVTKVARSLATVRASAAAHGVPVPDLRKMS